MFSRCVLVVPLQLIPQMIPVFVALCHLRETGQLVHDGVHLGLRRLFQIAVHLFALDLRQHSGQRFHLSGDHRTVIESGLHLPDETAHGVHGRVPHLLIGLILLLIEGQQLVTEDVVGQLRAHLLDAFLRQITLPGIGRPDHHVDVGVMLFIMEGGPPAKAAGRNFHRRRQLCLMGQQQSAPALTIFVAQPRGVLALQGVDEDPHRTGVCTDLLHGLLQVCSTVCGEQAVRAGTFCHVLQIAASPRLHQFHAVPGGDVLSVVSAAASRLDVARLLNETLHSSILF